MGKREIDRMAIEMGRKKKRVRMGEFYVEMEKKALEESSSSVYIEKERERDEIDIQTEAVCDFDSPKVINSSDGCFVAGMKKPWCSTGVSSSSNIYSFALSIECNDEKQVGNETGRAEEKVPDSVCEQRARVCVYIHVYNYTPYNVPVVVACKLIVLCCYNFTRRKYIYRFTAAIISPFTSYYVLPEGYQRLSRTL